MRKQTELLCQILNCEPLDVNYLCELLEKNTIEISDCIRYWDNGIDLLDFNVIIYEAMEIIAKRFIINYENDIKIILGLPTDKLLYESDCIDNELYEIYTNFLDSHIYFFNDEINRLFQEKGCAT